METQIENNRATFDPPLWRQRRSYVNEVLRKHKITSLLDYGCGEGALLSFLIQPCEEAPITRLAGVDINHEILQETQKNCRPWSYDNEFLRSSPLTIDLYQGSVDVADKRLLDFEAIVCVEVVEHLDPPVLEKFFQITLGTYKPKILIVTTPNVEFNVYFPQLKYGTPEATLRVEDHRFEWTRKEFQDWAHAGAARYNYSVEITGVGRLKESDPKVGFATQIALFLDTQPEADPIFSEFGEYQDIEHIVFPHYDEPEKSHAEIIEEVHYYMQYLCNRVFEDQHKTYQLNGDAKKSVPFEDLWDIHRLRQICRSKDKLRDVLCSCADFTMPDPDIVLVHREYVLNSHEPDTEYQPYTNNGVDYYDGEDDGDQWDMAHDDWRSNPVPAISEEETWGHL